MRLNRHRARLNRIEAPILEAAQAAQAAALKEARRLDQERLCELLRKRNAPSEYGGPLTDAETQDLETLWQRPRVAVDRRGEENERRRLSRKMTCEIHILKNQKDVSRRFNELEWKAIERKCTAAEQEEVELLRATYGISPVDNPLFVTIMHLRTPFGTRTKEEFAQLERRIAEIQARKP
jgi:hypothetical protein